MPLRAEQTSLQSHPNQRSRPLAILEPQSLRRGRAAGSRANPSRTQPEDSYSLQVTSTSNKRPDSSRVRRRSYWPVSRRYVRAILEDQMVKAGRSHEAPTQDRPPRLAFAADWPMPAGRREPGRRETSPLPVGVDPLHRLPALRRSRHRSASRWRRVGHRDPLLRTPPAYPTMEYQGQSATAVAGRPRSGWPMRSNERKKARAP